MVKRRSQKHATKVIFATAVVLGSLVFGAQTAFADASSNLVWTWQGLNVCQQTYAGVGDWPAGGFIATQSRAFGRNGQYCDPFTAPPGDLAATEDLLKWTGSTWAVCNSGAIYYSGAWQQTFETNWAFNRACGAGWYGDHGRGWLWDPFVGTWRGGQYVWSGYVYIS